MSMKRIIELDDWREGAACRDIDPELFFPVSEFGPGALQADRAKAICASCPVKADCLEYALEAGLTHGIFGGLTEQERRRPAREKVDVSPAQAS